MFRVACTGNLCFGKCGVLHCSLWAVQTHNYIYATRNVQMHLKSNCTGGEGQGESGEGKEGGIVGEMLNNTVIPSMIGS